MRGTPLLYSTILHYNTPLYSNPATSLSRDKEILYANNGEANMEDKRNNISSL